MSHVELSPESTEPELNGQHKAGLLPLSHSTHAHVFLGHTQEVEDNKCKSLKSQEAFNLASDGRSKTLGVRDSANNT